MRLSRVSAIAAIVALCGCVAPMPAADVTAAQIKVSIDPYTGVTWLNAPDLKEAPGARGTYRLRGAVGKPLKGGLVSLRVEWEAREWAFLEAAFDINANRFPVTIDDRRVVYGGVHEIVTIPLTREYLEKGLTAGILMQVRGRRGTVGVNMPPEYIKAFVSLYDDEIKTWRP